MPQARAEAEMRFLEEVADAVAQRLSRTPPQDLGRRTGMGADGTPTKHVDVVAEEAILEAVDATDLQLNVLSEEAGFVDHDAERTLVVDPVDGTTNASRGLPVYCVSLAVGTERLSDVDVALVRNLPTGQTYRATAGGGATLDGEPLHAADLPDRAMASVAVPRSALMETLRAAVDDGRLRDLRHLGSATLEMCFVAQGALDAYLHPEPRIRVIDVAASTLVVREAGGHVLTRDLEPLDMPLTLKDRASCVTVGDRAILDLLEGSW